MRKSFSFLFILSFIFISFTTSFAAHSNFTAYLNGANEVPSVSSTATGTAAVTLTGAGGLRYSITVNGLSGPIPVVGAHFHIAPVGENGPIIFDITGSFIGNTAVGSIAAPLADSVIAAFLTNRVYLDIHSAANPDGEIRGQVNLTAGTHLIARFDGLQEVPSVATSAKAIAAITMESVGSVGLAFSISAHGLSGPITGAHFHFGKIGENGPIVFDITSSFNGNNAKGVWRTSGVQPLNDSLITALLTGKLYLNIHTSANPGGEIRGQIELASGFGFYTNLNGASEVPPVVTTATGTAELTFTDYGMIFHITATGLSGAITGAHFHVGDSGVAGPIVFDITNRFVNNTASGVWKASGAVGDLTPALMRSLFNTGLYLNIHTSLNPGGEIRGQCKVKPGSGVGGKFTALQEVPAPPAFNSTASGTASLYTVPTGLQYFITVNGLTGPITGAHFHFGGIREVGPIVKDILSTFTGNTASGIWTIAGPEPFNDSLRRALVNGKIYLNIHTAANPGGEIRAQALLSAGTGMISNLSGIQETPPVILGGKGTGSYTLTRGGLGFNIAVNGLSGPITGAHFHLGDVGVAGPIVKDIGTDVSGNNVVGYWREVVAVDSLFNALLNGRIYVNLHTASNPNGEVRGQVLISEGIGITMQLTSTQEVPPSTSNGRGTGSATLTDAGLVFFNTFGQLTSTLTGAHFHLGAVGVNGPIVRDLMSNVKGNNIVGAWKRNEVMQPITNSLIAETYNQNIYINIHTTNFPGGEIRSQLRTGNITPIPVRLISSADLSPKNAVYQTNTQPCVNAVIRDQAGVPMAGARVDFQRRGANPGTGFAITDTGGRATYCYIGTVAGLDTIIATILNIRDTAFIFFDAVLPVELTSFYSTLVKNDVTLNWTTSMEVNNSGFDIERSVSVSQNSEWLKVGNVAGNGTTSEVTNYTFVNKNVKTGKYYYRLKQIDFNGNFQYFNLDNEILVGIPASFSLSQNYPNPFNPTTRIDYELPKDGNIKLLVYDMTGKLITTLENGLKTAGYYTTEFNSSNLSSGVYFYKIEYNDGIQNFDKVLKMSVIK